MVATGMIKSFNRMVDLCAHSRGFEWLICLVLVAIFPVFRGHPEENIPETDIRLLDIPRLVPPGSEAGEAAVLCVFLEQTIWI